MTTISALSLPTADHVNMLGRYVEKLETRTDAMKRVTPELEETQVASQDKAEDTDGANAVTFRQWFVAKAVGSIGVAILAAVEVVANVALIAVKIVPVVLNETIGRWTGLSKYVTSPALTREDFFKHFENIRRDFIIALNALLVLTPIASADMIPAIARNIKLIPVAQVGDEGVNKGDVPPTGATTDVPVTEVKK